RLYFFILYKCNLTVKRITLHPQSRNTPKHIDECRLWVEKWMKTDMNYLKNCVFVD
ncbi:hypothetical protein BDF14DRAFT_1701073, partial [Spinellus fusiger]